MNHIYRRLRPFILVLLSLIFLVSAVGVVSADNAPWNCPDCGRTGNTGNYCGSCGHPAPWMEEEAGGEPEQGGSLPLSVTAGDVMVFGAYPQTAEGTDLTPVEWLVLEVRDGKALLISKYGLDAKPYNTEEVGVTWETCSLRAWLNGEFLDRAFSPEEQSAILLTEVDNSESQGYSGWSISGANNTQDRIFLLSYAEANRYFGVKYCWDEGARDNIASRVAPTEYAIKAGALASSYYLTADGTAAGWWWLRSPGFIQYYAALVIDDGSLYYDTVSDADGCARPAFWLNLESGIFSEGLVWNNGSVSLGRREESMPEPTPEPTAEPTDTPEPAQQTGFAISGADAVPVRETPGERGSVVSELPGSAVVYVTGQFYEDGRAWHKIQYENTWGYVPADMLRMMTEQEVAGYLAELNKTPEPTPEPTAEPTAVPTAKPTPQLKGISAGDIITFGTYPQTSDGTDQTPIEWIVLAAEENKVLLISRYGLDAQPFNATPADVRWDNCTLREWLNEEFFTRAFSADEQARIIRTEIDNSDAQSLTNHSSKNSKNTADLVFLLSEKEAMQDYFEVLKLNPCQSTGYAKARGAYIFNGIFGWKTRTPWPAQNFGLLEIQEYGGAPFVVVNERSDAESGAIRPAIWVAVE